MLRVQERGNAQPSCAGLFILAHLGFDFPGNWLHVDMAAPAHCVSQTTTPTHTQRERPKTHILHWDSNSWAALLCIGETHTRTSMLINTFHYEFICSYMTPVLYLVLSEEYTCHFGWQFLRDSLRTNGYEWQNYREFFGSSLKTHPGLVLLAYVCLS